MRKILFLSLLFCLCLAPQAYAVGTYDFTVQLSGSTNTPTVTLTNASDALSIIEFSISIGNTAYNFDCADRYDTAVATPYPTQDTNDWGGAYRSDAVGFTFAGLASGETFSFRVDVDKDSSNTTEDYRKVLFNNGTDSMGDEITNALLLVKFSDNVWLTATLPDFDPDSTVCTYSYSSSNPTPVPGAIWLLGSGIAGLVGIRRKMQA